MKKTKTQVGNAAIQRLVKEMSHDFEESLIKIFRKIGTSNKVSLHRTAKKATQHVEESKSTSKYQVFIDVLKSIGRPAMTREIASRVKKVHPEIKVSKGKLIQQLYNSASYLAKEGVITRTPVGKRMYEYSLKEKAAA